MVAKTQLRRMLAGVALAAGVALVVGCGGSGGDGSGSSSGGASSSSGGASIDTTPPAITGAAVSPMTLPFAGGQVSIQARVTDSGGVAGVWAMLILPDSSTTRVDLVLSGDTYSGVWTAAANTDAAGRPLNYGVRIFAHDNAGNQASAGPFALTVTGLESPPAMPF